MSTIIVDDALRSRLNGLGRELTFCDESGNILGRFVPGPMETDDEELSENGELFVPPPSDRCPYTPEELARGWNEEGGSTLKEFWQRMGQS